MKKEKLFNSDRTLLKSEMLPFYELVELDSGEAMLFQGELTSDFFIIKSGKLEVVEGSGSKAVRLDTLEEGDVFGELAFLDEGERSATVRSLGKSVLYRMTRDRFADMTETRPELSIKFLVTLGRLHASKLRRLNKMIAGITGNEKIKKDPAMKKLIRDMKKAMKSKKDYFA